MVSMENLSQQHLDILKEIGNIGGAGNAATALSRLLNKKIDMLIPAIKIVDFNDLMEYVGGPDQVIVSVFLRIQGEAPPGSMFFVLTPEEAHSLVEQLIGTSAENLEDNELAISAISEIGNILSGSYLSALSDFTSINLQPTVPNLTIDMAAAILMQGLVEISQESDYAIIIDTMIEENDQTKETVKGHFFLLPDPNSFDKIFRALGGVED
ncbi:chemotaxis protein CheC - inhibitor of MCP methylation [Gracilibacillus boraciitolerans JCM 21714]|uniref:Chemotaxis protein CheC-inhibitor of MCP methylation n=1 Tax=Gracilibacillus boraciitolerans JCM 21714 TaxID=1298598 RepID=W4VFK1_9BACI|nr:chemotaxis protein CheC [Gracilibacillus boraciitolerans]GAE91603.1 chemotaxis protein CheC - inhibitor of MCP methylation [Gracilibacillus boraciitolerans JCM 21714]